MKNKIMLGLSTLATCLPLTSCGESEEKKNNEMEEIAFSMASAKCDECFQKETQNYIELWSFAWKIEIPVKKQLMVRERNYDESSAFYVWFLVMTSETLKDGTLFSAWRFCFMAFVSWRDGYVKVDNYGTYHLNFAEWNGRES